MNQARGDWLQKELCTMLGISETVLTVQDFDERIFVTYAPPGDRKVFSTPHTLDASTEKPEYWLHRFTTQLRRHMK